LSLPDKVLESVDEEP